MPKNEQIQIVRVTHEHLPRLAELWKADWFEQHPGDTVGAARAAEGIAGSLAHYDSLRSDSFWLLAAQLDGRLIGYATVIRIPKIDDRRLFLFVDELFVLQSHRRLGAATALLGAVTTLASANGAAGIRLITECDNVAAMTLYERNGFEQHQHLFCQRLIKR